MPENKRYAQAYWVESRKRWQCKVQFEGQRKTFTSSTPGRRGKAEAERKADLWLSGTKKDTKARFWPLYEKHLADLKERTSEGNYANAESLGRIWLKPLLETRYVHGLTAQDWQDCINAAKADGKSLKTLKNIRGAISSFCTYCKKCKIPIEDAELVTLPTDAPVGKKTILQPNQLRILFSDPTTINRDKVVQEFFIYAFRFCVLTGLRRGELLGLQNSDIDDGTHIIHVQRSINKFNHVKSTKSAKSERTFLLNKHMLDVLAEQRAMLKAAGIISPWLFPDEDGAQTSPSTFYKRWNRYRDYHGIVSTFHELRHTLVSIAKAGLTAELLRPMVGHTKDMDTFGVYGHPIDGEMQLVADTLDELFDKHLHPVEEKK